MVLEANPHAGDGTDVEMEDTQTEPTQAHFVWREDHKCIRDLFDEWYGTGKYPDAQGGIDGRNKSGKKWRTTGNLSASHSDVEVVENPWI